ncbi:Fungal Zn2-Cys6 binuclear cluster domain-containing protein [Cladophialophora immunda]|nr:Fungal Zn2-Cys6 binuclear cluster domain-containing protein [Cladophialophora immunda]
MAETEASVPPLEPRRACQECNRKKTKCDMRRPVCGLCLRTGNSCTFPLKRKKPTRKPQLKTQSRKISDSLSKLVQVLDAASRAGEGSAEQDGRRGIPQTLLRDSLKGLLAEIAETENHAPENQDQSTESNNQNGSASDAEDIDEEDPEADGQDLEQSPPATSTEPTTKLSTPTQISALGAEIPCSVAIDLIYVFFDKVQAWVPILHRPRFLARYEKSLLNDGDIMKGFTVDESLLFYSMFAMSARFSNHPVFAGTPPNKRGHEFAQRARDCYAQARSIRSPSLTYLQGCILLAYYFYTSGPTHQGWILIGVCVRLAYDLGLSEIDDEDWSPLTPMDSVEREEFRRAWWAVWELDTFASTVSRHPYSIDRKRMAVALPVSDEAWFAEIEVSSAQLNMLPGQSWRSLQGCSNQDERAWFLVANHFMATVHDRLQQKQDVSADEKLTLENEICCFKLALPASLRLDAETLTFTPATFARCNWVIGTHLMLMAASFMVSGIATAENDDRSVSSVGASGPSPLRQRAIDLSRIISLWDSRYIAVAHPFFTCMMLPPYYVDGDILRTQPLIASSHDLGKLVLAHFSERWKLGSVVSELAKILERGGALNAEERQLAKRYAVFFRMPRLSGNTPPDLNRRERNNSTISDNISYPGPVEVQQRQPLPQEEYPTSLELTDQTNIASYQAPMFDPQNFPVLQPQFYDGSNEIEFGFSDFFGGYQDLDFMPG